MQQLIASYATPPLLENSTFKSGQPGSQKNLIDQSPIFKGLNSNQWQDNLKSSYNYMGGQVNLNSSFLNGASKKNNF